MNITTRRTVPAIVALALLIIASAVIADGIAAPGAYDLSWNTVDGGGGTSTGAGGYELSGTIGQPDAGGAMTGGTFSLTGGFWPGAESIPTCPGDISPPGGNGAINVDDMLAVITHWGACPLPCPPSCLGDIAPPGGNCAVNVDDLLFVITHWGPCP